MMHQDNYVDIDIDVFVVLRLRLTRTRVLTVSSRRPGRRQPLAILGQLPNRTEGSELALNEGN